MRGALLVGTTLLAPTRAFACPSCPTSRAVAQIICGGNALSYALAIAAPFSILTVLVFFLHRMDA